MNQWNFTDWNREKLVTENPWKYTHSFSDNAITDWISENDWTSQLYGLLIELVKWISLKLLIKKWIGTNPNFMMNQYKRISVRIDSDSFRLKIRFRSIQVQIDSDSFGLKIYFRLILIEVLSKNESVKFRWFSIKFHWLKLWEVSHWESVKMLLLIGSVKTSEQISFMDYWLNQCN